MSVSQLNKFIFDRWNANHQVVWIVTEEPYRCQTQIQQAAKDIKDAHKQNVKVVMQDKAAGFYTDRPSPIVPLDKTTSSINALQIALGDAADVTATNPQVKRVPFDYMDNLIFVFKDWDVELSQPQTIQFVRNAIQSNMGSETFYDRTKQRNRGRRMLIFMTTSLVAFDSRLLPEMKPHYIPLPDAELLRAAIANVTEPLVEIYKESEGKKGIPKVEKAIEQRLIEAGAGLTYQYWEDTLSLALATHKKFDNLDKILEVIEEEKAAYVTGIPGCTYVPKSEIEVIDNLPGFEQLVEFVNDRIQLNPEKAKTHNLKSLRGISLGGPPGVGKTRVGMAIARLAGRILLNASLGEVQGSYVGDSEANMRRLIQMAQAMRAVVLIDDVDKGGVSIATGAIKTAMEGGPFGRMIQMLLTEMSSPENQAIWIFTFNRAFNLPGELIRPGRMDQRFFVDYPDEKIREQIINVHLRKRNMPVSKDKESQLRLLASNEFTDQWSGSELESMINTAAIKAARAESTEVDWTWLCKEARATIPMAKQELYKEDIKGMRDACQDFVPLGKTDVITTSTTSRAKRNVVI